ncbi:hypothetical protein T11_9612 [Trichinella zimbabwensis]|uniref:Uncharacterized protein n=1 Tax=Trichinella zimbabwensis TaxID=268475 RepID=A0A0V1HJJ0_9BILA|nr:hypothetical protein T11_9612 [Trichinella zimbabwensis]
MTRHVSPPHYRTTPLIFKSKYTTVAECNSDVVRDQFRLSSSSSAVSGIEQASTASRTVTHENEAVIKCIELKDDCSANSRGLPSDAQPEDGLDGSSLDWGAGLTRTLLAGRFPGNLPIVREGFLTMDNNAANSGGAWPNGIRAAYPNCDLRVRGYRNPADSSQQ